MKIFKETPLITKLSYVGVAACLASNLYLYEKVPEEIRLTDIEEKRMEISQTLGECNKGGYISLERKCLDAVQKFDNLGTEAEVLRNSPAYLAAQKKHTYSDIPVYAAGLFTLVSFLGIRSFAKRKREEQDKKNSVWKEKFEASKGINL